MSLMCYPSYQHLFSTDHTSTHTVNTVYKFYKYCRTHLSKFDLFCFKDADVRTQLADGWSLRTDKWTGNATTFKTCSKNSQSISKHIQRFIALQNPSMSHLSTLQEPDWEGWAVCHDSAVHRSDRSDGKRQNWQQIFLSTSQVQLFQVAVGHIPLENRQRAPLCRTNESKRRIIAMIWNHFQKLEKRCVLLFSCLIFYVYIIFCVFCERLAIYIHIIYIHIIYVYLYLYFTI